MSRRPLDAYPTPTRLTEATGCVLEPCPACGGTGQVEALIEGELFTCLACGGHKTMPAPDSGPVWFFSPGPPWRDKTHATQRVASVAAEPDGRWRVTTYAPDGPQRHEIERREEAFGQLRDYRMTPLAARMLDAWSRRPAWATGLKRLAFAQYVDLFGNACRVAYDALYEAIRAHPGDLDAHLAVCRELHAQYCPDEELW